MDLDPLDLVIPSRYGENGRPFELFGRMRREAPVLWCEPEGYEPFFAITTHEDIVAISRDPELFSSEGRNLLVPESDAGQLRGIRSVLNMDPPDHTAYRKVASPWFVPRNVARLEERVRALVREILDGLVERGVQRIDFVAEIATTLPLRMICGLLGIPVADEAWVLRVSNEIFGNADPELKRPDTQTGSAIGDVFRYFSGMVTERRQTPGDDLVSLIASGTVYGKPMGDVEALSNTFVMVTAGHDTTRNALSGGIEALIANPDQLQRLRDDLSLIPTAVEEILRFTTPVNHFLRTATRDTELRGVTIRKGQAVALFYGAANRDESVFEDPDRFRIDRKPNPHLAFGIGEHFCMGAALARMEIRVLLEELLPRLQTLAFAGEARYVHSNFVNGRKALPIELRLEASSTASR